MKKKHTRRHAHNISNCSIRLYVHNTNAVYDISYETRNWLRDFVFFLDVEISVFASNKQCQMIFV